MAGLKPHTHAQRAAIIEQLISSWQQKFGDDLLAVAACASFARNEDTAYSDLELEVFVKQLPSGEPPYYQRVVDGMLIEALYRTPLAIFTEKSGIPTHWYLSASDRFLPVYNAPFIEKLVQQAQTVQHSQSEFVEVAAKERYELQEAFSKVLNAVEQNNQEGVSLLVMDAAMRAMHMLAFINQQPFVTFSRYILQARQLAIQPPRFDELLDILVQGTYQDLPRLREVALAVFEGLEQIFAERDQVLFEDPFDPNQPTLPETKPTGIHLVPVNRDNLRQCIKLPTGPDHRHVARNEISIAQAQFLPGASSCCIYNGSEMVGYILYLPDYDVETMRPMLWIYRLMIAEDQRGKGYGRKIMQQVIEEARQQGCQVVGLSTHPDNHKAIGLYESLGFQATEMEEDEMVYLLNLQRL